ncbi:MAG TPA: hydroxymethylbilane synthase, partial [Aquabacterium sp.]|nr:hydroxymethylbilane synthase [Aquabacterium sp.]
NLDTRLRKLDEGQYDAIILAAAGLKRLGLGQRIQHEIAPDVMLPAAGQGALGLEVRTDQVDLITALRTLIHAPTWLATQAERAVSRAMGGSCSMPLAAFAEWSESGDMNLRARLGHPEQVTLVSAHISGRPTCAEEAIEMGQTVAQQLKGQAGPQWLSEL